MKYDYDGKEYEVHLIDDGTLTLDTIISVNGFEVRLDPEYALNFAGDVTEDAIAEAVEAYLDNEAVLA